MANAKEIINSVANQNKGESQQNDEFIQLVVFDLDNEEYAVEIKDLQEIIKMPEVTIVPGTPEFIRGIFNLRGKIIVVLDLEKRFKLERQEEAKEGNVIIAEVSNNSFGIIVDKVTEIINVANSSIQQAPALTTSKIQTDYLKGVVVLSRSDKEAGQEASNLDSGESRLIILLDLPKMLSEKELMSLQEMVG